MSDFPRVRIVNRDGRGLMTQVFIDDVDVSSCFSGVNIKAGVHNAVTAQLEAVVVAVDFDGVEHLRMPAAETTRELLIRHGWTPPAEPVEVPSETRAINASILSENEWETLRRAMLGSADDCPAVGGRELLDQFLERLESEWEPKEGDTLSVERVKDEHGNSLDDRLRYTLQVVLDKANGGNSVC